MSLWLLYNIFNELSPLHMVFILVLIGYN